MGSAGEAERNPADTVYGDMSDLIALVAVLTSALFAGAALYINLVEHPARLERGTRVALEQFAPSYRRATITQVTLASVAAASGTIRWLIGGDVWWLVGAFLIFVVMPYTVLVMFPTNKALVHPDLDPDSRQASELLDRWGRMHAVRSIASLLASLVFIWSALRS